VCAGAADLTAARWQSVARLLLLRGPGTHLQLASEARKHNVGASVFDLAQGDAEVGEDALKASAQRRGVHSSVKTRLPFDAGNSQATLTTKRERESQRGQPSKEVRYSFQCGDLGLENENERNNQGHNKNTKADNTPRYRNQAFALRLQLSLQIGLLLAIDVEQLDLENQRGTTCLREERASSPPPPDPHTHTHILLRHAPGIFGGAPRSP
jgi:hypothetical protein